MNKLYIVVRRDLPEGVQLAQACHVAFQFALCYPAETRRWNFTENNLVVLNCEDEDALRRLFAKADGAVAFREPDLGYTLTAIAVPPSKEAQRLLSSFPLALRGPRAHEPAAA